MIYNIHCTIYYIYILYAGIVRWQSLNAVGFPNLAKYQIICESNRWVMNLFQHPRAHELWRDSAEVLVLQPMGSAQREPNNMY